MFSSIRNRLILIAILVGVAVFSLIPRNVTIRERGPDGVMMDTTVRRVPLKRGLDLQGGIHLALEIDESQGQVQNRPDAIERVLTVIRSRIDEFGIAEPVIQRVGNDRIIVELAGIDDPTRAKQIVQRSAFLEFRITDTDQRFRAAIPAIDAALIRAGVAAPAGAPAVTPSAVEQLLRSDTATSDSVTTGDSVETPQLDAAGPLASMLFTSGQIPGEYLVPEELYLRADSIIRLDVTERATPRGIELFWAMEPISQGARSYRPLYALHDEPLITGDRLSDANANIDPVTRGAVVQFRLTRTGGRIFRRATGLNVNNYMAILLDRRVHRQPPIIRSQIGRDGVIELGTGASLQEAQDLALVLRAGALPAPIVIVEERNVGPSLGRDSIRRGTRAAIVAAVLVLLIMAFYYRLAGFFAIAALAFYMLFTVGGLATMGFTLTLPGLAGFVLSLGLAVDANVLIFERVREELKLGKTPRSAIDAGFQHAMPAIIDANVTTVITAAFLFQFGTGPVKGFAVTLIIGIIASLITAVFVTRTIFLVWLSRRAATAKLAI